MKQLVGNVYYVRNIVNGKGYVGFTNKDPTRRMKTHIKGGDRAAPLLHEAIIEFGVENFTLETLFVGSHNQALKKEQEFIKKFKTLAPNGYNQTVGGESAHSVEACAKISTAMKGRKPSIETRANMSAVQKARFRDPEVKATTVARLHTPEARKKMGVTMRGNKHALGNHHTEAYRARLSAMATEQIRNPEHRAAMLEGHRRYYANKRKDKQQGEAEQ